MNTQPPANSAETILSAALDHAPEDREAFLVTACKDDAVLLAEVRALLAAHEAMPESFLAEPAVNDILERDLDATIKAAPGTMPQRTGGRSADADDLLSADMQTIVTARPSGTQSTVGPSSANPSPPVPFIFGKRIAQGGMGAILETEDCKLGRTIAAKVMLLEQDASEDMRQRFIQEAAVLAKLAHPNIVPVYDLGHDADGQLYYTMKLVKGRTLQNILDDLRHEQPEALREFTLERLLTIFRKVADALAFAHSKGILHRDLKPENVMVGEFGEVLLMDWGLAKVKAESGNQKAEMNAEANAARQPDSVSAFSFPISTFSGTLQGSVMGTPKYMSPEQAMGRIDELDARSDIFSLGGILYAILTLRPPVEGKTVQEVLAKVSSASITAPTAFGATASNGAKQEKGAVLEAKAIKPLPHIPAGRVPAALSAVAMKALTLDKARRYQDVAAFSADIEAYQTGFATTAEEAGLGKQLVLLIKRNKGIFTTAAAAWFIITALAVWFVFNLRAKERRAVAGETKATAAEAVAVREKETARQALAKSQLDLAEKEFERGKFVEAEKILDETPERFRGANWRFLRAHSRDFTAQLSLAAAKGSVHRLQFLPQGDRFAARFFEGAVGIFTLAGERLGDWIPVNKQGSGNHSRVFGIDGTGGRIAFSPSAKIVAVQEITTGQGVRRWASGNSVDNVLLSPDGGLVLAAGGSQLAAYAAETGAPRWTHPSIGAVPAFSPDGRTVAVLASKTGLDFKIQLLDSVSGAVRRAIEGTSDKPIINGSLHFNQAGDQLAFLGSDEVILWNPQTTGKTRALHFPGETVRSLSPVGDVVATISSSRIRLWDTATGRLLRSLNGSNLDVLNLAFSPDGKMLLSSHASGWEGLLYVWPIRLAEEIASSRLSGRRGNAPRVVFNRDGSEFYACASKAGAWETRGGRETWKSSTGSDHFQSLAIHPTDGSIILSETGNPPFTHMSSAGEALEAFGTNFYSSVKFNRGGQLLLVVDAAYAQVDAGRAFSVMEYPSGKVLRKIPLENPRQPSAAFCLDDAAVATAALAGGITVWDWQAGTPLRQIDSAQTGSIACLASSPDGLHLATGGPDRWIRVWEARTGRLEVAFRAHWEGVRCVKFSPDGREILSGSEDGTVRLHDAAAGEERLVLYGHTMPVADVDISADGTRIAAITEDGLTKVWDRQLSSAAALLPKGVIAKEPVAAAGPPTISAPPAAPKPALPKKPKPAVAPDADGWEDHLASLSPAEVEKSGHGWSLKDGELFSPDTQNAMLPLLGDFSGTSYRLRVKLRQLPATNVFYVTLPVADRMCGFYLETRPEGVIYTGLGVVNGKAGKEMPGAVKGKQINDTEPHSLEVTVRLDGANATITSTLDGKPLYEWTGPTAALSQFKPWATTEPGALALGTYNGGWAVSEVKLKRLEAGK